MMPPSPSVLSPMMLVVRSVMNFHLPTALIVLNQQASLKRVLLVVDALVVVLISCDDGRNGNGKCHGQSHGYHNEQGRSGGGGGGCDGLSGSVGSEGIKSAIFLPLAHYFVLQLKPLIGRLQVG